MAESPEKPGDLSGQGAASTTRSDGRRRQWRTIRRVGLVVLLLLLVGGGGLYSCYVYLTESHFGENVDRVPRVPGIPRLPESASKVSFYQSYIFTAYEFDVPETDFLEWAEGWPSWKLRPIGKKPLVVTRYHRAVAAGWVEVSEEKRQQSQDETTVTITKGYMYESRKRTGGGITVGYDPTRGRAYVQHNPR